MGTREGLMYGDYFYTSPEVRSRCINLLCDVGDCDFRHDILNSFKDSDEVPNT